MLLPGMMCNKIYTNILATVVKASNTLIGIIICKLMGMRSLTDRFQDELLFTRKPVKGSFIWDGSESWLI